MRSICFLGALASCFLTAAPVQAGTLTSATWLQVTQGVPMTRTTTALGATGTSSSNSIAVNLAYPQFTFSLFVPKTSMAIADLHIKITQGGPQTITATPAMGNGNPGIPGTVIVMSAQHVGMGVNSSVFMFGPNTLVAVPVSVGRAGTFAGTFTISGVAHTVAADFFAWTPGMATFTGLTSKGAALPSVMAVGSFALTAAGGGTVTLVSPTRLAIDGVILQRRTASFTTLKLTFVPEPSAPWLLAAGAVALGFARRR